LHLTAKEVVVLGIYQLENRLAKSYTLDLRKEIRASKDHATYKEVVLDPFKHSQLSIDDINSRWKSRSFVLKALEVVLHWLQNCPILNLSD
jgi:hypothetical protein